MSFNSFLSYLRSLFDYLVSFAIFDVLSSASTGLLTASHSAKAFIFLKTFFSVDRFMSALHNSSNMRARSGSEGGDRNEGNDDNEAHNASMKRMTNFECEALKEINEMISMGEKLEPVGLRPQPQRSTYSFSSSAPKEYVEQGHFSGWNELFTRLQQRLALNPRHWFQQIPFHEYYCLPSVSRVYFSEVEKRLILLKQLKKDVENQNLLSIVRQEIEQDVLSELLSQAVRCLERSEFHAVILLCRTSLEWVMKHVCTDRNIAVTMQNPKQNPTAGKYLEALKKNGLRVAYYAPWKAVIEWGNGVAHNKPNSIPNDTTAQDTLRTVKNAVEIGLSVESSALFQKPSST